MEHLRMTKWNGKIAYLLDMDTGEVSRISSENEYIEYQIQQVGIIPKQSIFDEIASSIRYCPTRTASGENPYICSLEYGKAGQRLKVYFDASRPKESRDRLYNSFLLREEAVAFNAEDLCLPAIQEVARRNVDVLVGGE